MFFSDLEVELLTLKILFLIFFEFCFWNLKKKFKADVLICVRVKLDKIWGQCIESEKFFFRKKKKFRKKCFFSKKKNFLFNALSPNFVQFYSYTYQNIRYILLFKVPKKKLKIKFFKVKSSRGVKSQIAILTRFVPYWCGVKRN